tara:strand:- start:728 stop:928 length:201 start_codon:yes stop_codon:yes gene_type:complete
MEKIQVEFTVQEAQVLVNILDIATKAGGLKVAESCVIVTKRLQAAMPKIEEEKKEEEKEEKEESKK